MLIDADTRFPSGVFFYMNSPHFALKGIVQRDLTGVETRLKQSVLLSYSVGKFPFGILKGHHNEKSIKPVSAS